jgi:hypothetical protein
MLGYAAALGIAPAALLRADPVELPLMVAALDHAAQWQHERDQNLARMVINELARALKR